MVRRKMRLEEASVRADELVKAARKMSEALGKGETRKTYKDLGEQLVLVGTDIQAMVSRLRDAYEDPIFQDAQLQEDPDRALAMDRLLTSILRALRETERMSDPITVLAAP